MLMRNDPDPDRLAALRKKLAALERTILREGTYRRSARKTAARRPNAVERRHHRIGRISLAPGVTATTLPGSMYTAMFSDLAENGHLADHERLFRQFGTHAASRSALKLLREIGVPRSDFERRVRAALRRATAKPKEFGRIAQFATLTGTGSGTSMRASRLCAAVVPRDRCTAERTCASFTMPG